MRLDKKKIFLGTAQFLTNYGIVNTNKSKSKKHFLKILDYAGKNNIFNYDTAPNYNSEKLLGDFIHSNGIKNLKIITKIPKIKIKNYKLFVEKSIEKSLKNLRCGIDTLFFHNASDLIFFLKDPKFFLNLKNNFPIKRIGVSIYEPNQIDELLNHKYDISIQFPLNVLNHSFIPIIKKKKIHSPIFARSIFLQGILLKKIKDKKINQKLVTSGNNYLEFLNRKKICPLEFSLSFINQFESVNYFIFGIENQNQLEKIIKCNFSNFKNNHLSYVKSFFNKKLIDPRNW